MSDEVVALDVGFVPNSGAPQPVLFETEHDAVLIFWGQRNEAPGTRERVAVTAWHCMIATFGYPNDEALPGHRLYESGLSYYGVFEVLEPSWRGRIIAQNQSVFPKTPAHYERLRHFIVTFQDSTFECLAEQLSAQLVEGSIGDVLRSAFDRSAGT
jgi:hypothetical protein